MRVDGIFIGVEVDDAITNDEAVAAKLAEVCPVDIYRNEHGLKIVEENLDECVLCGLCLNATKPGQVKVLKLYDDAAELARAS
jgi:NAD-dependent dihydropyrimidine dehydrogenase PreA subunit